MQSMYEKDWFMRQIKLAIAAISKIIFGKDVALYEIKGEAGQTETDKLHPCAEKPVSRRGITANDMSSAFVLLRKPNGSLLPFERRSDVAG